MLSLTFTWMSAKARSATPLLLKVERLQRRLCDNNTNHGYPLVPVAMAAANAKVRRCIYETA